jgi:choline dehydrogenase-like flavoprotein
LIVRRDEGLDGGIDMERFDYIVVGGGTAGCVLAARLSQDPDVTVLLLEAGPAAPIPDMADPARWWKLVGSSVDWNYETVPQAAIDNALLRVPQGKVLGGSSGINGVMFIRGDRSSYDVWEASGAPGWNYEALLPFFKISERTVGRDPAYRGQDGPVYVTTPSAIDPLWEACFEAAVESGYPYNEDSNAATAEGTSWNDNNLVDGKRLSAADAYLIPVVGRPNLSIRGNAHVRRLLLKRGICRGIQYRAEGQTHEAFVDREVVLAAGAIPTPKLLLLSGVGPGQHLRSVDIDVEVDLPGVGENLHDHVKSQVAFTTTAPVHSGTWARKPHVLLRSKPSAPPDLQILFVEFPVHPRWAPGPQDGYSVVFGLMTPVSRGYVRLASPDPEQPPLVNPEFLADPIDTERLMAGLRVAREIGAANALGVIRDAELFPGPDIQTDAARRAYLRSTATSYTHVVGTCKIGTDAMAVVDTQLKVHGVENLRIADASVMPSVVSGNTNATVFAIAERAAHLLAGEI